MEKRSRKFIPVVLCALAVAALAIFAAACAAPVGLSFSVDGIDLFVGESRDLFAYVRFDPATVADKSFSLESDSDSVTVTGTTVKAVKPGRATVTATKGDITADIVINSAYRPAGRIALSSKNVIQNVAEIGEIVPAEFFAELDDYVDPASVIEWFVDGDKKAEGEKFVFAPPGIGEYEIEVRAAGAEARESALIYRATEAEGESQGELGQHRTFSPVRFFARERIYPGNPPSVYEWTVNGEPVSSSQTYSFCPRAAGEYEIALFVNGVKRKIDGSDSTAVTATGERAPTGSVEVSSSGVYIVWPDGGSVRSIAIQAPDGTRSIYSNTDITQVTRFEGGRFDATDLIAPCAAVPGEYKIRMTAEAQGDEFTFTQYPSAAARYISDKILLDDLFIADAQEAYRWILEAYACGRTTVDCYAACAGGEVEKGVAAARAYLGISVELVPNGNIYTAELSPYENSPSVESAGKPEYIYAELPHIEYIAARRRPSSFKLYIERARTRAAVQNTEQLLLSVEGGALPVCAAGSAAAKAFGYAKKVLIDIIGADYDRAQKVHAIYDWLQWVMRRAEGGSTHSCNYIDSIFGGAVASTGAVNSAGAAKSAALLLGMEGIKNEIAYRKDADGIYYWNRVSIGDIWYDMDVYGGKYVDSGSECCSHAALFLDGEGARARGLDMQGEEGIDGSKSFYLQKSVYLGVYTDRYISGAEKSDGARIRAAIFKAFDDRGYGEQITMPGIGGTIKRDKDSYGAEFCFSPELDTAGRAAARAFMISAVKEYAESVLGIDNERVLVRFSAAGDTVAIMVVIAPEGA